jgi:hypothetical protein
MAVGVNPPKTPCTKGSGSLATATLPNICKMPGPPAPFVPTPLPNIGKSGDSPQDYTTTVTVEGNSVAIHGASFGSMGDMASKGTGGGIVSNNTHGPCKFIAPGSMDVKFEGKNVQLLSDQVTNNGGPSGSPANAATMQGLIHAPTGLPMLVFDSKDFPEKTANMRKSGMKKTKKLTRQTDKKKIRANRRAALSQPGVVKGPSGTSLDEFPFASSTAGGTGAAVTAIDVDEQNAQGGKMSSFYQNNGIGDGDSYVVMIK